MKNEKISIIVAVYNVEPYIKKCIESITQQDYTNIEIILVDDCSTDQSGKICDHYAKKDSRIKVIHHKLNSRLPTTRNSGLEVATGKYIIFVDGDDWLAKDFTSYMLSVIKTEDCDMAINLRNFTSRDLTDTKPGKVQIWSPEKTTAVLLYSYIAIGAWNKIYKKDFLDKNNLHFKNLFTAEGFRFISDASQRADKIAVGDKKVYYYRLNNPNSATTKPDIRQSREAIKAIKDIEKDLTIRTPLVMKSVERHIFANYFWNIQQIISLKMQKKYRDEYRQSIYYLHKNFYALAEKHKKIKKKIELILMGIMPRTIARIYLTREKFRFKKDVRNISKRKITRSKNNVKAK